MTLEELIAQTEVELEAAQKRQQKAKAEIKLIIDTARQEGRANLTEEESVRSDELFSHVDTAKADESGIKDKLARLTQLQAEEREADKRSREVRSTGAATPQRRQAEVSVVREERTYHRGNDPAGKQFLKDIVAQFVYNDVQANERLARHMKEERVERGQYLTRANDSTANFSGLTVPQYLTDMVAPAVANMKPFADLCTNKHQLPADGMSVNISKITTPTTAGLQSGENATLATQGAADTLLTIPVQTAGGWVNVSRQAIDRGTGIDDVIMQDLFKRYYTDLDNQLLNQASTGLANVSVGTAAAGTTGQNIISAIIGGMSRLETALLGLGKPSHAVMHPRRWYYLQAQFGSNWPMINFQNPSVPSNQAGTANDTTYGSTIRGVLPNGLAVVADANVTNSTTDEIYVVAQDECHLWQDPAQPAFIRAEQPNANSLGVMLVVYGYYAYTFNRYSGAMQKITQTGFTAPTF